MKLQIVLALVLIYSAVAITSDCQSGYILNNQNSCIKPNYLQGCFIYQSQIRCHTCKYGFVLATDGSCQISTSANGSCCQQKSLVSSSCLSCSQGLFLLNGSCVQINVWGCAQQDNNGVCLTCGAQFYLKNGKCQKGIRNCIQYSNNSLTICTKCSIDFTLFQNSCLPNKILGCKNQINEECVQCHSPFQLKSNKCEVPNCNNHNDFGCTGCECGYYLTADKKCASVDQGCIRYQRGICTDCMAQFKLKGGICQIEGCLTLQGVICTSCKKGYVQSGVGCKMQNCIDWLNGQCFICQKGFNYVQGSCIASSTVQVALS